MLITLSLAAVQLSTAPTTFIADDVRDHIEDRCNEYLWALYEERSFPGGSAALVLPSGERIAIPIGFADVEAEVDMRVDDLLLSGSIGKTYVTAAAHRLMLAGKLSFDQKAIDFFEDEDWFRRVPNSQTVTLSQLLHHQSGIPRYIYHERFFPDCLAAPHKVWTPKQLLSYVFDDTPIFAPGEGWAYSDTNYIVLGMVIEKVSGMTFYGYVRTHFLEPLGLKETVATDRRRVPGVVQGTVVAFRDLGMAATSMENGVFRVNPQFEWCGGGFASTARDLAGWAWTLFRGAAMEGAYLDSMLDTVPARLAPGVTYGCGVMISETNLGPQIGHDGVMIGYSASMAYFPDIEVAAAILLNTDDGSALGTPIDAVVRKLAAIAMEELAR